MSDDAGFEAKYKKLWERIEGLSPEEQRALKAEAADYIMRRRRIMVNGKPTTLRKLKQRVEQQRKAMEGGETERSRPRYEVQESIHGSELRQGAYKMQLRQREEKDLELDRFGEGVVFSPRPVLGKLFNGRRDFAWGIYARPDNAEAVLQRSWAARDPQEVLEDPNLYWDIINHCHKMELTLMVYTSRALPLADTRQQMGAKLQSSMQRLAGGPLSQQDKADLKNFVSMFADERVASAGWMDAGRGCVMEGTHFLFSTGPRAELAVEAITPGPLRDRKTSYIGVNRNKLITGAVFDMFLGPEPLDEEGKEAVGKGMVWAANGFRFRPWETRPGQYIAEEGPDGELAFPKPDPDSMETMALPIRPNVFQLLDDQTKPLRRMLLSKIRRAKRQQHQQQQPTLAAA